MMVVLFLSLSLSIQPRLVFGENTSQPKIMPTPSELGKSGSQFQAVISKDTILVGESAVITFKGRQLDVAGATASIASAVSSPPL